MAVTSVKSQGTRVGFYSLACPRAEFIVRSTVESHFRSDPAVSPGLLRMHFHDCFVQGCDASILVDGPNTEKTTGPNLALRGYEVIDDAKSKLEAACPGVDIPLELHLASSSGTDYTTLLRRTGNGADPSINPAFLPQPRALCPQNGDGTRRVGLDTGSPNRFDSSFFTNLRNGRGILESDQKLWTDASTRTFVERFIGLTGLLTFNVEFGKSMVKMSNTEVKTGNQGEIRKVCSAVS
ncbi:Peroxidase N1 [Morus notabilis]|uniref:peroxidase n=1 Tax=Morus notabilis TaxID=981085 RepID=W9RHY1_9ROSA|nr:Peroxidase N1 [Morus notabilis]